MSRFRMAAAIAAITVALLVLPACSREQPADAEAASKAVAALLDVDRAASLKAAERDAAEAMGALFSQSAALFLDDGRFVSGRKAIVEALRADPADQGARASWKPWGGGMSADGQHGFTFGHQTVQRADGSSRAFKYLAYWKRDPDPDGWRLGAYKRIPATASVLPPDVATYPPRASSHRADDEAVRALATSMMETDAAFSRDVQSIGLVAAFERHVHADAINLGRAGEADMIRGAPAIARFVGEGQQSGSRPPSWRPNSAAIADSGDLGVTFGDASVMQEGATEATSTPYFAIWRRDSRDDPWRQVAE